MRLMATRAGLVSLGCCSLDIGVAALTFLVQGAGVGLVTALTVRVPSVDLAVLALMAALALHLQGFRPVRQPTVAVGTGRVPRERGCLLRVLGVALRAERGTFGAQQKVMRLMTVAAIDPLVQSLVVRGFVVTRRTVARAIGRVRRTRVRIVAAGAAADFPVFGVVRRNVRVAAPARRRRSALHVVRIVAARALVVSLHTRSAEHQHVFVAVPASHRLAFLEFVGSVTTGALGMPFEQGSLGNAWLLGLVAGGARIARLPSGGVLMRMTGGAGRDAVFAGRSVRGADLVAVAAGRRSRFRLFVRAMARKALLGMVHAHRRDVPLVQKVTARTITGGKGFDRPRVSGVLGEFDGESVAGPAVSRRSWAERFARLVDGVLELGLLLVAVSAAFGPHRANFGVGELVALVAGDLFQHDMLVVAVDRPCRLPLLGNVDPLPVSLPGGHLGRARDQRGHRDRECQREGKRPVVEQSAAMIVGSGKNGACSRDAVA